MLQYTVEPTSYLKILTVKTFCLEQRHILGEGPLSIALELESLSYQSVIPADKVKLLTALNDRCAGLLEILTSHATDFADRPDYEPIRTFLTELVEIASGEISRMTTTTCES